MTHFKVRPKLYPTALQRLIQGIRTKHSLTQLQLAGILGVSERTILRWENDTLEPRTTLMPRLRALLAEVEIEIESAKHVNVSPVVPPTDRLVA